jgi:hypothetical protein
VFNLVSSRLPIDIAVEMADKNVASDMRTNADILDKLRAIQSKGDKQDEKRVDLELEQKEKDIKQTEAQIKATEEGVKLQKEMSDTTVKGGEHKETEEDKKTRGKSPAEEQMEKALSDKEEKGYSRLEQKQKEKTRVGSTKRSEKLAKAKNKSV